MTPEQRQELLNCQSAVRAANYDLEEALKRHFPIGGSIRWQRGLYPQNGVVEGHGFGSVLLVRNSETGKKIRITEFEILQAASRDARDSVPLNPSS